MRRHRRHTYEINYSSSHARITIIMAIRARNMVRLEIRPPTLLHLPASFFPPAQLQLPL